MPQLCVSLPKSFLTLFSHKRACFTYLNKKAHKNQHPTPLSTFISGFIHIWQILAPFCAHAEMINFNLDQILVLRGLFELELCLDLSHVISFSLLSSFKASFAFNSYRVAKMKFVWDHGV